MISTSKHRLCLFDSFRKPKWLFNIEIKKYKRKENKWGRGNEKENRKETFLIASKGGEMNQLLRAKLKIKKDY